MKNRRRIVNYFSNMKAMFVTRKFEGKFKFNKLFLYVSLNSLYLFFLFVLKLDDL